MNNVRVLESSFRVSCERYSFGYERLGSSYPDLAFKFERMVVSLDMDSLDAVSIAFGLKIRLDDALLRADLLSHLVFALLLRLSWVLLSMQLIMLRPFVGIIYGMRVILLMWWPSSVLGFPPLEFLMRDIHSDMSGGDLPTSLLSTHPNLAFEIDRMVVSPDMDSLVWTCSLDGVVSCKAVYGSFSEARSSVSWGKKIWAAFIPLLGLSSLGIFIHGKIPSDAALHAHGFIYHSRCPLCYIAEEDLRQLLLECPFVLGLWDTVSISFGHNQARLYLFGALE
ncbi:hypothetical protein Dsin_008302 [Dipteronia sinensis]|uniref:Reverse transcriptase zinc-binding domain-containing protein n=1 Tax=Dipteronia sinensis TaxID=43782 RepID=A0AAE0APN5_9ROSI|nr:hypothetical protein Dsin_008302 [Dipteronia sinensis]